MAFRNVESAKSKAAYSALKNRPKKENNSPRYGKAEVVKREGEREPSAGYNVSRDATGNLTGINFDDGRQFNGLNNDQVQQLIKEYKNRPLSQDEQFKKKLDEENAWQKYKEENTPQQVTPEAYQNLGEFEQAPQNERDESIQANIENQQRSEIINRAVMGITGNPAALIPNSGEFLPGPNDAISYGVKAMNKLAPGSGTQFIEKISKDEDVAAYLNNYNNKDNIVSIKDDMTEAYKDIEASKSMAGMPNYKDDAPRVYADALSRINRADAQLKKIGDNDPSLRSETDEERKKIQRYLYGDESLNIPPGRYKDENIIRMNAGYGGMKFG